MRPPRLIVLLFCFIALPVFLTFLSLVSTHGNHVDSLGNTDRSQSSRLRALFSFHTPSSLFLPSAIISLTNDNSTFFLARPADFGPLLPNDGLSGQLWVGRGFGGGSHQVTEGELGCSDVPGWGEGDQKYFDEQRAKFKPQRKKTAIVKAPQEGAESPADRSKRSEIDSAKYGSELVESGGRLPPTEDDGTDDHLHHPLPESNPAEAAKPGQPAEHEPTNDKTKKPTHADIQSLQESAEIAGKVALLSRGGCGFLEKVKWVQRRGGIAVIVGDDEPGKPLITMYARGDTSNVTIPAIFTTHTTAHLLSSLVPPELVEDFIQDTTKDQNDPRAGGKGTNGKKSKSNSKVEGPNFTPANTNPTAGSNLRPSIVPVTGSPSMSSKEAGRKGWLSALGSILGLGSEKGYPWHMAEDSRRPPSSGNINWVLLEDWDEDEQAQTSLRMVPSSGATSASVKIPSTKTKSSPIQPTSSDDFVIGVQDWRDPDLVAPGAADSSKPGSKKVKPAEDLDPLSKTSAANRAPTASLKGGSITPGSGEYEDTHSGRSGGLDSGRSSQPKAQNKDANRPGQSGTDEEGSWLRHLIWGHGSKTVPEGETTRHMKGPAASSDRISGALLDEKEGNDEGDENEGQEGLWVTLTPTSVSTSPFFDTLLVLVVSPLVTLTVVYALLLLRSRIRRRRWRAPKSVVERLPVRTYHTMSTSSSTTSSQIPSPDSSSPASPLLRTVSQTATSGSRPRSQTTSGVLPANIQNIRISGPLASPPKEKSVPSSLPRKRYMGRQVECVVCLEEYVDGQSRVMSLPCGHEFHVECITPWLVTRRRTCPICKGDVVRSMANLGQTSDLREEGENRSDDIQVRAAETVNDSPSAAIPIPVRGIPDDDDDSDVERGTDALGRLVSRSQPTPRSSWRNLLSGSLSALSGETLRQTPADRNR